MVILTDIIILVSWLKAYILGLPWWSSGKESALQRRGQNLIPDPGRFHLPQSNRATTTEPMHQNYWSQQALEPVLCNKSRHCKEKPVNGN